MLELTPLPWILSFRSVHPVLILAFGVFFDFKTHFPQWWDVWPDDAKKLNQVQVLKNIPFKYWQNIFDMYFELDECLGSIEERDEKTQQALYIYAKWGIAQYIKTLESSFDNIQLSHGELSQYVQKISEDKRQKEIIWKQVFWNKIVDTILESYE